MPRTWNLVVDSVLDRQYEIPFEYQVARGQIDNIIAVSKFGQNTDIDIGSEDIIGIGGTLDLTLLSGAAATVTVVSSSINDDLTGTGAEKLTLYGLGEAYELQSESITLDGTTPVASLLKYRFIYRAKVTQSANGANTATNAGILTFSKTGGANQMVINIGNNQTLHCAYMIPDGYAGYLKQVQWQYRNSPSTDSATVRLWVKDFNQPYQVKYIGVVTDGSDLEEIYNFPLKIEPKAIIKLSATVGQNNTSWAGQFELILIPTFT